MEKNSKKNLTEEIEDILTREIMLGVYPPGGIFPSEYDSVKRFGVSRVTVRRVYANMEAKKILCRKKRFNTTVNDRLTATSEPIHLVGAVLPIGNEFSRIFLEGLNQEAALEKSLIVLAPPFRRGDEQGRIAIDMVCGGVRNLIVWGCDNGIDLETFRRLRLLGINLVFFDHIMPGAIADYVSLDHEHAIALLMEKALANGCSRFVFVNTAGLEVAPNKEREYYFVKFCKEKNLPCSVTALSWQEMLENGAPEACRRFFDSLPDAEHTGIFGANSFQVKSISDVTGGRGSFYSISTTSARFAPNIYNVVQPISQMAERCFELLRIQQQEGTLWKAKVSRLQGSPDWLTN